MDERVAFYEKIFDELTVAAQTDGTLSDDLRSKLQLLEKYYTSGEWREDYEADEAGLFLPGLKRGVLSQDAVYDLLEYFDMKEYAEHTGGIPELDFAAEDFDI